MSTQPWSEGIVQESEIVFYGRGPKAYINYQSTIDNQIYEATFDGGAVVLQGDRIRITVPPTVGVPTIQQMSGRK